MGKLLTVANENSILDMTCAFLPTAFILSSACVFISLLSNIPHIPTMAVGVVWLFSIMSMSLLRLPPVQCIYLFARYGGVESPLWTVNKVILTSVGARSGSVFSFVAKNVSGSKGIVPAPLRIVHTKYPFVPSI